MTAFDLVTDASGKCAGHFRQTARGTEAVFAQAGNARLRCGLEGGAIGFNGIHTAIAT